MQQRRGIQLFIFKVMCDFGIGIYTIILGILNHIQNAAFIGIMYMQVYFLHKIHTPVKQIPSFLLRFIIYY